MFKSQILKRLVPTQNLTISDRALRGISLDNVFVVDNEGRTTYPTAAVEETENRVTTSRRRRSGDPGRYRRTSRRQRTVESVITRTYFVIVVVFAKDISD